MFFISTLQQLCFLSVVCQQHQHTVDKPRIHVNYTATKMAITDEDLQFMADGMWKDAFLPDLPDIYGIDIDTDGEPIELPAPGDKLLDPKDNGEGSSSSRKKATPATKQVKAVKNKAKGSGVSPMTDLYLSSPTEVRPKKNGKMSKSMKGAPQNESQRGRPPGPAKPHKPVSPEPPRMICQIGLLTHLELHVP